MNKYIASYLIFNMLYSTLFVLLACGNEEYMIPWWITLISAIIPSLITAFVSLKISKKAQLQQLKEIIEKNNEQIHGNYNTIITDIGRMDNASLTKQHEGILTAIEKETQTVERRYEEDERRYRMFTSEQQNTAEQIEQFKLFMEDWKRLAARDYSNQIRIEQLEEEIKELRAAVITQQPGQKR